MAYRKEGPWRFRTGTVLGMGHSAAAGTANGRGSQHSGGLRYTSERQICVRSDQSEMSPTEHARLKGLLTLG